jgi:hypothetical protein
MSGIHFRGSVVIGCQNDGEIHGKPIEIKDRDHKGKPVEIKDHRIGGHKIHGEPIEIKGRPEICVKPIEIKGH